MRPVINLKPLNGYLKKTHFKMDTLSKVLNLVKTGDWAISLDLKDAYLHVPIFHTHRKYLRFCIQNQCYQFKVLCFEPTSAPSLHKNTICSGSIPEDSRHKTSCVSRRLADCKSEQKAVIVRSRELSQSPEIFRFSGKQRKIDTYPNPNSSLLGEIVSSRQGLNLSHSRENSQVKSCDRKSFDSGESISFNVSTSSRHYGLMFTNDSECLSVHETSSATSFEFLETKFA